MLMRNEQNRSLSTAQLLLHYYLHIFTKFVNKGNQINYIEELRFVSPRIKAWYLLSCLL